MTDATDVEEQWNKIVHTGNRYWIIKESDTFEYTVMKKPAHLLGNGKPIAFFSAKSKEQAIKKGIELAQEYGYK